jgi:hypothetical protein
MPSHKKRKNTTKELTLKEKIDKFIEPYSKLDEDKKKKKLKKLKKKELKKLSQIDAPTHPIANRDFDDMGRATRKEMFMIDTVYDGTCIQKHHSKEAAIIEARRIANRQTSDDPIYVTKVLCILTPTMTKQISEETYL